MNPLLSVKGSLVTGFVLAFAIAAAIAISIGGGFNFNWQSLVRWLHILAGITWIGLLYYFNVVQVPGLAAAAADKGGPGGAGVTKYIAPRALLWFRWAAVATLLFGLGLLGSQIVNTYTFGLASGVSGPLTVAMGVGAWFGTIMAFNVWVFIWPNQKKILGIVPATDEEKATARKVALLASRTNFVLSIPMLMCMVAPHHGLPF
jgi:uncharacterized membrane protein